jgi:hypothetical protein
VAGSSQAALALGRPEGRWDLVDAGDGVDTLRAGPRTTSSTAGPAVLTTATARPGIDTAKSCEVLTGVP